MPNSRRIAAIDWMRGIVMVLMVVDHASMAFNGEHLSQDSALYADAGSMALPTLPFVTRWLTHLCAPTFVFLAGTALAISIERKVARGADGWGIDKAILTRGALIALLDPTIISLGSGRWTFQVLFAIGVSMMLMAPLRRLPTWALLALGCGWIGLGEFPTDWMWDPPASPDPWQAFTAAVFANSQMVIKYPVLPWLAMMMLGWVFGRYLTTYRPGCGRPSPVTLMLIVGTSCLGMFLLVRGLNAYGNMFLLRADDSWQQWLHVSKYPPSLSFTVLELGLFCLCLGGLMALEPRIGVRENGPLLVFGQTAMFFYLVHRLVLEVPATWLGLRGAVGLTEIYAGSVVLLLALYPACLWYRRLKATHPQSFLKWF
jgi:uncharacterized membrane protein